MTKIQVNPDFFGPTLPELLPILDNLQDEVDVRWGNTRDELRLLRQLPDKSFTLHVPDLASQEVANQSLGKVSTIEPAVLNNAVAALGRKSYNWRTFTEGIGYSASVSVVTKLAADAIRRGKNPSLAPVADACLHKGVNPNDADVLLRIRALRGNKDGAT